MGRHTDQLKAIIARSEERGIPRERAIRRLKKRLSESLEHFEDKADQKREMYEGILDEGVAREIEHLQEIAAHERERIKELEEIE